MHLIKHILKKGTLMRSDIVIRSTNTRLDETHMSFGLDEKYMKLIKEVNNKLSTYHTDYDGVMKFKTPNGTVLHFSGIFISEISFPNRGIGSFALITLVTTIASADNKKVVEYSKVSIGRRFFGEPDNDFVEFRQQETLRLI